MNNLLFEKIWEDADLSAESFFSIGLAEYDNHNLPFSIQLSKELSLLSNNTFSAKCNNKPVSVVIGNEQP